MTQSSLCHYEHGLLRSMSLERWGDTSQYAPTPGYALTPGYAPIPGNPKLKHATHKLGLVGRQLCHQTQCVWFFQYVITEPLQYFHGKQNVADACYWFEFSSSECYIRLYNQGLSSSRQ